MDDCSHSDNFFDENGKHTNSVENPVSCTSSSNIDLSKEDQFQV
jgi:hypothetical protein